MKSFTLLLLIAIFSGCVVNRKLSFNEMNTEYDIQTSQHLAIAVTENRSVVLSGKKKPTFVGTLASSLMIPYNMHTKSGLSLAEELGATLYKSLSAKGLKTTLINASDSMDLFRQFNSSGATRLLQLKINEWLVKGKPRAVDVKHEVVYDLALSVFSQQGSKLANVERRDVVAKTVVLSSVKKLNDLATEILANQLNEMMHNSSIRQSLK